MAKALAERFGPDTIAKFEKAARMRFEEAESLRVEGHHLAAVYFFGYVVEMVLKAAYFRMLRYGLTTEIGLDARNRAMARARGLELMGPGPHDLVGWARFLVTEGSSRNLPAYDGKLSQKIVEQASIAYASWRPEMRYRATSVSSSHVAEMRASSGWFLSNYGRM
jgi:hypothetical protein